LRCAVTTAHRIRLGRSSYLAVAGAVAAAGVDTAPALLSLVFLRADVLCLAAGSVFFIAVAAAGAVAGAPVCANTGSASADKRAATKREVDFMADP